MRAATSVPVLTDGVVVLRPPAEADVDALVEQSRDPETPRWTTVPGDYGPQDARDFLAVMRAEQAAGERSGWVIERDGAFAGTVHLRHEDPRVSEVGFAAHPAQRGRGNTTRAVRLVSAYAFEHGDAMVVWNAWVGNFASRRVAWATGFDITPGVVWRAAPPRQGGGPRDFWTGRLLPNWPMTPHHAWPLLPVLTADGIVLRDFREQDADRLPDPPDPALTAYAPNLPGRDGFADWVLGRRTAAATGQGLSWAIADEADDRLLGSIDLTRLNIGLLAGTGLLGYWLLPDARGSGVTGRAVDAVLDWALRPADQGGLGLHQVEAGCASENRASARVLRRAGMTFVGTERRLLQVGGQPRDNLLFAVLDTDDREALRTLPRRIPTFETERFRLRPWAEDDAPGPDDGPDRTSLRYMPPGAQPDAAGFPAWLVRHQGLQDEGDALDWCVADRETDRALGNVTLFGLERGDEAFQAEAGYWLFPSARGRGVVSEALAPVVDHAFRPRAEGGLGLARLHASIDPDNLASEGILLRAGFREWGRDHSCFRNALGEVTDGAYFELLATDERVDRRPRPLEEVTLTGDAVRIRPVRDEDASRIQEACSDPVAQYWLSRLPDPYTLEHAHSFVRQAHQRARVGGTLSLVVADRESDVCLALISVMGLDRGDPGAGEIGYWAHPDARGRGVMSEGLRLVVSHAFAPPGVGLGLRKLVLKAAAGNGASQAVAAHTGFDRAGLERVAEPLRDGTYDDVVVFDRVNPAWTVDWEP